MKKISIIIPTLTVGGGEKIAVENANDLSSAGYEVYLIVPKGKIIKQTVNPSVRLITGSCSNLIADVLFCLRKLRAIRPDVVLSYMERANFINIISSYFGTWDIYCSIHTVPSEAYKTRSFIARLLIKISMLISKMRQLPYICVSKGVKNELEERYKLNNVHLVENYINDREVVEYGDDDMLSLDSKVIISFVGRLNKIKGADVFIDAIGLANRKSKLVNKKFWVVGDGKERRNLELLAHELEVSHLVEFWGEKEDVDRYFYYSDYLIVPSYLEGFGLVVLEGLIYGCQVRVSKCKYGPSEIISHFNEITNDNSFSDPSLNRESAVEELSEIILKSGHKKQLNDINELKNKVIEVYGREIAIEKIINVIERER
ncbi:glycosyltransferase [Vibrio parahaemolyticus]|uniref:glycosyltransferase n=1 Tax=Vibrio parahaemolyticus TaxID=670 RepID=UPI0016555ABF|nr:glycosyltransferase [Vibrio parahaemolyticus]MBC8661901.1 glycosyltransferase [Vibrio parahaemolyticus]